MVDVASSPGQAAMGFTLPALLTIETAEAFAAECKQWPLEEKTTLTLDASVVENITTPAIQLIVSLEKTLVAQGGALVIVSPTEAMVRAFNDVGLQNLLG